MRLALWFAGYHVDQSWNCRVHELQLLLALESATHRIEEREGAMSTSTQAFRLDRRQCTLLSDCVS